MSVVDDARAEAERIISEEMHAEAITGALPYRTGFVEGADWQASRKVEAPADDREALRRVVGAVLWNVSNYPHKTQSHLLGTDTAPLTAKVIDALLAAGYRKVDGEVEWGVGHGDHYHVRESRAAAEKSGPEYSVAYRTVGPWVEAVA